MKEEAKNLPLVSWSLYQLVWVTHWWDWELAGIAQRDGHRIYFECVEETDQGRKFAIYDPPAEVWAQIDQEHRDFQRYVGTHWDFEPCKGGVRRSGCMRPQSEHHKF